MDKIKITLLFITLFACSYINTYGQNRKKLDSLRNEVKSAKHDTIIISSYYLLGEEISAYKQDSAIICFRKGLEICSNAKKNQNNSARIYYYEGNLLRGIGKSYIQTGDYEMALDYLYKALNCYMESKDEYGKSQCYKSIGAIRYFQGDAVKSIEAFQSSMKIAEKSGDLENYSDCINNIGMVHYQQDNNDIALVNFKKALEIRKKLGIKSKIAESYNNLGIIYSDKNEPENSLTYYFNALELFNELNQDIPVGKLYNNIGVVYKDIKDLDNAETYFLLSLENKRKIQDRQGEALVLGNLSNISISRGNYINAIRLADSSLVMAKKIGSLQVESNAYGFLFESYEKMGNFKKSLEYHKLLKTTSDSLSSVTKFETISEMEAKYQNEKKQLEIEKMQKQKELDNKTIEAQTAKNRKQQIIIFSAIGGFLIVLVFSIIILRMFGQKRKANILLANQNIEIQQKSEEISAQRDEIEAQRDEIIAQRDLVYKQKEQIEVIHKKVTDSINYAKRIQEAVLPTGDSARSILGDHFILFKPKDIVSGDFYWGTRINEWLIVTVADCTGHGVPGAFMSMLGVSFLNEIVRKKEITKASDVLDNLRESIIEALQQKGATGEQKDGMDIVFCAIKTKSDPNSDSYTLQFAGANNSLYIVRNNLLNVQPFELCELNGDKQPVSIYENMTPFTNHVIQLNKGDTIYLISDGYADQFSSPLVKGGSKKFKLRQLKDLFVTIADKSLPEQKEILDITFENWRGNDSHRHDQIDDVTILGLRI